MISYRATLGRLAGTGHVYGVPAAGRAVPPRHTAREPGADLLLAGVLGLRWFRGKTAVEALARNHGISRATGYRLRGEVIGVLSAQAPELPDALARALAEGVAFVILDGKIVPSDRCLDKTISVKGEAIDLWYSGKAHHHRGNIQAVVRPDELPLWISAAEPGSVHDITAARIHALPALYRAAAPGLPALADTGYQGAGIGVHIPVKQPGNGELDPGNQIRNAIQPSLRCLGEHAFALLNQRWRTLQHITASPSKITGIARAALILTQYEHGDIKGANAVSLRSPHCNPFHTVPIEGLVPEA